MSDLSAVPASDEDGSRYAGMSDSELWAEVRRRPALKPWHTAPESQSTTADEAVALLEDDDAGEIALEQAVTRYLPY